MKRWFDDWSAGWKDSGQGIRLFFIKLPNAKVKKVTFKEGERNWRKMAALHSFAESALMELSESVIITLPEGTKFVRTTYPKLKGKGGTLNLRKMKSLYRKANDIV